jgi:hypothetical protein
VAIAATTIAIDNPVESRGGLIVVSAEALKTVF